MGINFVRSGFVAAVFLVTMIHSVYSDAGKPLIVTNDESPALNKPNNFTCFTYYDMPRTFAILKWDPPLPGHNHLLGYICYFSKLSADIDKAKPIDTAQWDSVAFTSDTQLTIEVRGGYINLVALYEEGKSGFLDEWIRVYMAVGNSMQKSCKETTTPETAWIRKAPAGYLLDFKSFSTNSVPQSAVLLSSSGRRVAKLTDIRGDQRIFNLSNMNYPPGLYVVKVLLSDKSTAAKQFNLIR